MDAGVEQLMIAEKQWGVRLDEEPVPPALLPPQAPGPEGGEAG